MILKVFLPALLLAGHAYAHAAAPLTCDRMTHAQPGIGAAFKGAVANDGYNFTGKIPDGLTAWEGVGAGAPFHGFTIFLNRGMTACINFEIHIRVDDDVRSTAPRSARKMRLGQALAKQWVSKSQDSQNGMTSVVTEFSMKYPDHVDDGVILLLAPTSEMAALQHYHTEFVRSIQIAANR